jgi:hypothetical protein
VVFDGGLGALRYDKGMEKGVVGHQVLTFITFDKCPGAHLDVHLPIVGPKDAGGA